MFGPVIILNIITLAVIALSGFYIFRCIKLKTYNIWFWVSWFFLILAIAVAIAPLIIFLVMNMFLAG